MMRLTNLKTVLLVSLIPTTMLLGTLAFAESGTLLKADELRAKPFADATVITSLNAREPLEITTRKGAWANVQTPSGKSGWIRVLNIRTGSDNATGDSGVGSVASLFKTGSSGNTVSTGVKGLSEEKLKNAAPNPNEAHRLTNYKTTDAEAKSFAAQGKLTTQEVGYLQVTKGAQQ